MAQHPNKLSWREKVPYGLSASQFGMALGFCGKVSDFVTYQRTIVGTEQEFKGNEFTDHGIRTESRARSCYELLMGVKVHNGGFFSAAEGLLGASPDGRIFDVSGPADNGRPSDSDDPSPLASSQSERRRKRRRRLSRLLEIKSPFRSLYDGSKPLYAPFGIPQQYMCQMQGQMFLSGAPECDFFVFLDQPEPEVIAFRVHRSEAFWQWALPKLLLITKWLRDGLPDLIDRSFEFSPFPFESIVVEPLVFPSNIATQTFLLDRKKFPVFGDVPPPGQWFPQFTNGCVTLFSHRASTGDYVWLPHRSVIALLRDSSGDRVADEVLLSAAKTLEWCLEVRRVDCDRGTVTLAPYRVSMQCSPEVLEAQYEAMLPLQTHFWDECTRDLNLVAFQQSTSAVAETIRVKLQEKDAKDVSVIVDIVVPPLCIDDEGDLGQSLSGEVIRISADGKGILVQLQGNKSLPLIPVCMCYVTDVRQVDLAGPRQLSFSTTQMSSLGSEQIVVPPPLPSQADHDPTDGRGRNKDASESVGLLCHQIVASSQKSWSQKSSVGASWTSPLKMPVGAMSQDNATAPQLFDEERKLLTLLLSAVDCCGAILVESAIAPPRQFCFLSDTKPESSTESCWALVCRASLLEQLCLRAVGHSPLLPVVLSSDSEGEIATPVHVAAFSQRSCTEEDVVAVGQNELLMETVERVVRGADNVVVCSHGSIRGPFLWKARTLPLQVMSWQDVVSCVTAVASERAVVI